MRETGSEFQQRIEDIASSGFDRRITLSMVDRLAEMAEHPDDKALIKATPDLRERLSKYMEFVLKKLEEDTPAAARNDSYRATRDKGVALLSSLNSAELDISMKDGKLILSVDGKQLASVRAPGGLDLTKANLSVNGELVLVGAGAPAEEKGKFTNRIRLFEGSVTINERG